MMKSVKTKIAIVGGGPAGLAAAVSTGDEPTLIIDDNPEFGGQIWRAERGSVSPAALEMVNRIVSAPNIAIQPATRIFDVRGKTLFGETDSGAVAVGFEKLIIATGARELMLPFPGWTLPGVFAAGGLQAMVKGGLDVAGKRIVVAGTGPLLLAVADYLRRKKARVVLLAEQAPRGRVVRFGSALWRFPGKTFEALRIAASLLRTDIAFETFVMKAGGDKKLEYVEIRRGERIERIDCDMLACGYHLVPNTELAELLGCRIENGAVAVDDEQQTSVAGFFCAGETVGIGGVELSVIEGEIAGCVAADRSISPALKNRRERYRAFAVRLEECFALRDELRTIADDETIVCRCEDSRFGDVRRYPDFRTAKLQTRCGMGACGGRICGAATRFLFGWNGDTPRPPLFPVRTESLCGPNEDQNL